MNRNASPVLFGWDFQINAAIFIFLNNIKEIDKVRLEGELQDIEFIKKDKTKMFAQAKAIMRYDDYTNVLANLKSAMISLNEAQEKDSTCNQVIYVTNTPNPFNQDMYFFNGTTNVTYHDLPMSCRDVIDRIIKEKSLNFIKTEQFSVQVIPFHGEILDNRYKVIKECINEFLSSIKLSGSGLAPELMTVWHNEIFRNGTVPNTSIHIKKSELVWPLIFLITDQVSDEWLAQELDDCIFEDVKSKYRNIINNSTDRFELYTKISYDYSNYSYVGTNKDKIKDFIEKMWTNYKDDIKLIDDITIEDQEYIIKLIIHKILVKKNYISIIKMEAGL